jgi:hypothetical protein
LDDVPAHGDEPLRAGQRLVWNRPPCVLFARTHDAAAALSRAWREHEVEKRYRALASHVAAQEQLRHHRAHRRGGPPGHGRVPMALPGGKASRSLALVLQRRADSTLFEVDIQTGRSQQSRIHLAFIGHPLVASPLRGARPGQECAFRRLNRLSTGPALRPWGTRQRPSSAPPAPALNVMRPYSRVTPARPTARVRRCSVMLAVSGRQSS